MSGWDLLVVGGGPVGLVTAIAARQRGLSVALVERSASLPEKACGEGLMPGALAALAQLGVSLHEGQEFQGIRFVDGADSAEARFPGPGGRGLCRASLMQALDERARAAGVERLSGCTLREFEYRERVLHARLSSPAANGLAVQAQLLVAADGLRSGVRRRLGYELPPRRPARFGLQRHYTCAPWSEHVEVHWQDGAEAYVTPLGRDQVGVALLTDGAPAAFEAVLARFPQLLAALGAAVTRGGRVRGAGPFEQRVRSVLAPGVALVGDAAGYLDAISGEGLALGFRAALALVDRFASGELWRYPRDHARIGLSYHALTLSMLEIARRPRLRRAVIRFLGRHPRSFADLLGIAAQTPVPPSSALGATLRWSLQAAAFDV